MPTRGIDVSKHQGAIDWEKVKQSGVEFAILRAGWSWYNGGMNLDSKFQEYIEGAQRAGLEVGAYLYSYDQSPQAAQLSAQRLLEVLEPYQLTYPVYLDMEYEPFNLQAGKTRNTDICLAFLQTIQEAGYYAGLYCSYDFLLRYLEEDRLKGFDKWIAQYAQTCSYQGDYGMWQYGVIGSSGRKGKDYTISGAVPGISTNCDLDYAYRDYPKIIREKGLNGFSQSPKEPDQEDSPPIVSLDYKSMYWEQRERVKEMVGYLDTIAAKYRE